MIKITSSIKDDRKEWNKLIRQVKAMSRPNGNAVAIGVFKEQGSDLVDRAAYNEFGQPKVNLPERSYMRSTFDEWVDEIYKKIEHNIIPVLLEKFSKQRLLKQLGKFMETAIKRKIRSSRSWATPNHPLTIARKGKGKPPLIDTTQLVNSITNKIINDTPDESIRSLSR